MTRPGIEPQSPGPWANTYSLVQWSKLFSLGLVTSLGEGKLSTQNRFTPLIYWPSVIPCPGWRFLDNYVGFCSCENRNTHSHTHTHTHTHTYIYICIYIYIYEVRSKGFKSHPEKRVIVDHFYSGNMLSYNIIEKLIEVIVLIPVQLGLINSSELCSDKYQ